MAFINKFTFWNIFIYISYFILKIRPQAECLKGATVRLRKIFERLHKILAFECKNAQFTTVSHFLSHFGLILFAQNRNIGHAKKICLESLAPGSIQSASGFKWKCVGVRLEMCRVQLRMHQDSLSNEPWCTLNWTPTYFKLNPYAL